MATSRIVAVTVTSSSTVLATAATGLGTNLTTSMNAVITSPPTGYLPGSIVILGQPALIFDAVNYIFAQQYQYQTIV